MESRSSRRPPDLVEGEDGGWRMENGAILYPLSSILDPRIPRPPQGNGSPTFTAPAHVPPSSTATIPVVPVAFKTVSPSADPVSASVRVTDAGVGWPATPL